MQERICAPTRPAAPTHDTARIIDTVADHIAEDPDQPMTAEVLMVAVQRAIDPDGTGDRQLHDKGRAARSAAAALPSGQTRGEYAAGLRLAAQGVDLNG